MAATLFVLIPFVLLSAALAVWAILALKKQQSGVKGMLLGISVILVGGFLALEPSSNYMGFQYVVILLGLAISMFGFAKKE